MCDYALLVTEPTPFGLNDLKLAVATVKEVGKPMGVVINRCDVGDDRVDVFCRDNSIEILARLPNDRGAAEAYSRGELLVDASAVLQKPFGDLLKKLLEKKS
jgi:MinD superfamily P-loop ATPase